jgi:hypothetical protein
MLDLSEYKRIIIYQYGKVGSRTMFNTLSEHHNNVHHIHFLDRRDNLKKILKKDTLIITIVRNTYDRNISNMFQNIKVKENDFYYYKEIKNNNLNDLMTHYRKANIKHAKRLLMPWFKQFKKHIGVDIFEKKFNREEMYNVYKTNDKTVLMLRFEDIAKWEDILSNIFDKKIVLKNENMSKNKKYHKTYEIFKKKYKYTKIEQRIIKKIDHMSYFYSPEEIKSFEDKYT